MSNYKLSLMEQETIILYNQDEKDAEIYTHDPKLIKKMKEHPEIAILKKVNDFGGYTYVVPKKELMVKLRTHFTGERKANHLKQLEMLQERNRERLSKNNSQSKGDTPQ